MMMREQQWDRSNCRHFRIDVCLHQRIYMRAFVNARNKHVFGNDKEMHNSHVDTKIPSRSNDDTMRKQKEWERTVHRKSSYLPKK